MSYRTVIYDFDGTIFKSPTREEGEVVYFEHMKKPLPFPGWWGRLESLSPPVVPDKPGKEWLIDNTIENYRKDFQDPDSKVVLMTGRPYKNRKRIIEICDLFDLKFHEYYFRGQPGQVGNHTFEIKSNFIEKDIIPNCSILEIWEDRHIEEFVNSARKWKKHLDKVIVHDAVTQKHVSI